MGTPHNVTKGLFTAVLFTQNIMYGYQEQATNHTKREKKHNLKHNSSPGQGKNVGIIRPRISINYENILSTLTDKAMKERMGNVSR